MNRVFLGRLMIEMRSNARHSGDLKKEKKKKDMLNITEYEKLQSYQPYDRVIRHTCEDLARYQEVMMDNGRLQDLNLTSNRHK